MRISKLGQKYNLSIDTLRYYEKLGLLGNVIKTNGQREYSEEDEKVLQFILCLKKTGLSLKDIKYFIDLNKQGKQTIDERLAILQQQKQTVLQEIKKLEEIVGYLDWKINLHQQEK